MRISSCQDILFLCLISIVLNQRTTAFCNYGVQAVPSGPNLPPLLLGPIQLKAQFISDQNTAHFAQPYWWLLLFIMMNIRCLSWVALTVTSGGKGETNGSVWAPAWGVLSPSSSGLVSCILPSHSSNIACDDEISYIAFSSLVIKWSSSVCKTVPLFSLQKWILSFVR